MKQFLKILLVVFILLSVYTLMIVATVSSLIGDYFLSSLFFIGAMITMILFYIICRKVYGWSEE